VVFGSAGLLRYLREFGFETWGDLIDESYDDELDDQKRYEMAWQQVLRLWHTDPRSIYNDFQARLDRNHERFMQLPLEQTQNIGEFVQHALTK
jgi:hypothetical protein